MGRQGAIPDEALRSPVAGSEACLDVAFDGAKRVAFVTFYFFLGYKAALIVRRMGVPRGFGKGW